MNTAKGLKGIILKSAFTLVFFVSVFTLTAISQESTFTGRDYLNMSKPDRVQMIKDFKKRAREAGVVIQKNTINYCKKIDDFYAYHPDLLDEPAWLVVKTLAIMEYDWKEKGVDKETLARQWLGNEAYEKNKKRLAEK